MSAIFPPGTSPLPGSTRPSRVDVARVGCFKRIAEMLKEPAARGYHVDYRGDGTDRCPGCGRSHFWVRTLSAECAFCGCAIPLPNPQATGAGLIRRRSGSHVMMEDVAA